MKVKANSFYTYQPVPMDLFSPPIGVQKSILNAGDRVMVINMSGCPKSNTMGHCYIETMKGQFAGLVCTNSLIK